MTIRLALSRRQAAKLLGIDRGRTLDALVASGRLREVPWGHGTRIPLTDVQRLAEEGWTLPAAEAPAPRRRRTKLRVVGALTDEDLDREVSDLLAD